MLLLVCSLVLCACANGLAVGENKAAPSALQYRSYRHAGRYFFNPVPMNWTDASKVCRQYNGHLALPTTKSEIIAVTNIMTRYRVGQIHAGFHDQFVEGEYYTVKGKLIDDALFNNSWSPNYPLGGSTRNCGGINYAGLMDMECSYLAPSICEENGLWPGGFRDYEYIPGHGYYKYIDTEELTWPDAFKYCESQGAHLLILDFKEEHQAVFDTFNIPDGVRVWVGVHHLHANHYFVTIFDDDLSYAEWYGGRPTGNNKYDPYVGVTRSGLMTLRNSEHFICEYNPPN